MSPSNTSSQLLADFDIHSCRSIVFCVCLAVTVATAAGGVSVRCEELVGHDSRLQGKWESQSCEMNGKKLDFQYFTSIEFSGENVILGQDKTSSVRGIFKTDVKEDVHSFAIESGVETNSDFSVFYYGIYRFKGDELEITLSSAEPPREFGSAPKDGRIYQVMKLSKKK